MSNACITYPLHFSLGRQGVCTHFRSAQAKASARHVKARMEEWQDKTYYVGGKYIRNVLSFTPCQNGP